MITTEQKRADDTSEIPVSDEVRELLRERLATIEEDKKIAAPWAEVKQRILKTASNR